MSEQINSGQIEERNETPASGLLLSVEPLQASAQLSASDDNADTGGSGDRDISDAGTDTDGSDTSGADTDLTDALGADTDGSDAADSDGSDSAGSDSDGSDSSATIKIDRTDS